MGLGVRDKGFGLGARDLGLGIRVSFGDIDERPGSPNPKLNPTQNVPNPLGFMVSSISGIEWRMYRLNHIYTRVWVKYLSIRRRLKIFFRGGLIYNDKKLLDPWVYFLYNTDLLQK